MTFVEVAIPLPLDKVFHYSLSKKLEKEIAIDVRSVLDIKMNSIARLVRNIVYIFTILIMTRKTTTKII